MQNKIQTPLHQLCLGVLLKRRRVTPPLQTPPPLLHSNSFLHGSRPVGSCRALGCNEALIGTNGADYRGCQTHTRSGKLCQRWDAQTPHGHTKGPTDHPNAGLDENYCRNPDGWSGGIWCYTTDPATRWEECDPVKPVKPGFCQVELDSSGFCLAAEGGAVRLEPCFENVTQRWEFDEVHKSVQPLSDPGQCLTTDSQPGPEGPWAGCAGDAHAMRVRRLH